MLKKHDLHDVPQLYELMKHPDVFPFVRHKAYSSDEFYFLTRQMIEKERNGELISRTILDEHHQPAGTINLFDIEDKKGFLATWIGVPYFGKGYNQMAKTAFFDELFDEIGIEAVFIKIRNTNLRSLKAIMKFPYITFASSLYPGIVQKINQENPIYELFVIHREQYLLHRAVVSIEEEVTG